MPMPPQRAEMLDYAIPLESVDVEDATGGVATYEGAVVYCSVTGGHVRIYDDRGRHAVSGAGEVPHHETAVLEVKADDIVTVERDAMYLKCVKLVARSGRAAGQLVTIVLCTLSHDARDACFQLCTAMRPSFHMWSPLNSPLDQRGSQSRYVVNKDVSIPVVQEGSLSARVHCSLFEASDAPFNGAVMNETLRSLVTAQSALHCVCLKRCKDVQRWEVAILAALPGYVRLTKQSAPLHDGSLLTLLVFTTKQWLTAITHLERTVLSTDGAVAVSLRTLESSICFVANLFPPGATLKERSKARKRVHTMMKLGNPEIDLMNQFHHLFWFGEYMEPEGGCVLVPPPIIGDDKTGVWFRSLSEQAVGLSYAYSESVPSEEAPPLSVVYEVPVLLPFLSVFSPTVLDARGADGQAPLHADSAAASGLVLEFEHIELDCSSVPSLPKSALVMYPTGPFCAYAGSAVKPIERGDARHVWARKDLPKLAVVAGYTLEYLRRQMIHVALRDVGANASCNLVGVATIDLQGLPSTADLSSGRAGSPQDVNAHNNGVMVELVAPYCRHDKVWGEMRVIVVLKKSTREHHSVGEPVRLRVAPPAAHRVDPLAAAAQQPPRSDAVSNSRHSASFASSGDDGDEYNHASLAPPHLMLKQSSGGSGAATAAAAYRPATAAAHPRHSRDAAPQQPHARHPHPASPRRHREFDSGDDARYGRSPAPKVSAPPPQQPQRPSRSLRSSDDHRRSDRSRSRRRTRSPQSTRDERRRSSRSRSPSSRSRSRSRSGRRRRGRTASRSPSRSRSRSPAAPREAGYVKSLIRHQPYQPASPTAAPHRSPHADKMTAMWSSYQPPSSPTPADPRRRPPPPQSRHPTTPPRALETYGAPQQQQQHYHDHQHQQQQQHLQLQQQLQELQGQLQRQQQLLQAPPTPPPSALPADWARGVREASDVAALRRLSPERPARRPRADSAHNASGGSAAALMVGSSAQPAAPRDHRHQHSRPAGVVVDSLPPQGLRQHTYAGPPAQRPAHPPASDDDEEEEVPFRVSLLKDPNGRVGMVVKDDLRVSKVHAGSPSEGAGVQRGMRVCSVNNRPVSNLSEYYTALGEANTLPTTVFLLSAPAAPAAVAAQAYHRPPAAGLASPAAMHNKSLLDMSFADSITVGNGTPWKLCESPPQPAYRPNGTMQF